MKTTMRTFSRCIGSICLMLLGFGQSLSAQTQAFEFELTSSLTFCNDVEFLLTITDPTNGTLPTTPLKIELEFYNADMAASFTAIIPPGQPTQPPAVGNKVTLLITPPTSTTSLQIPYKVYAVCSAIPNNILHSQPILVDPSVAIYYNSGTPLAPVWTSITSNITHAPTDIPFPYLGEVNYISPRQERIDNGDDHTYEFMFINEKDGVFDGTISVEGEIGGIYCLNANGVYPFVNTSYNVRVYDKLNNLVHTYTDVDLTIPFSLENHPLEKDEYIVIEKIVDAEACYVNTGNTRCSANFQFKWGCGVETCKGNSVNQPTSLIMEDNVDAPRIFINRLLPATTGAEVWDAACSGNTDANDDTKWAFLVYNYGLGEADFLQLLLKNLSDRTLTTVDVDEIEIHLPGSAIFTTLGVSGLTSPTLANMPSALVSNGNTGEYYLPKTYSGFSPMNSLNNPAATSCVGAVNAKGNNHAAINSLSFGSETNASDRIKLGPNQGFIITFRTHRCCTSDLTYAQMKSEGVDYNHWNISATTSMDCVAERLSSSGNVPSGQTFSTQLEPVNLFQVYPKTPTAISTNFIEQENGDLYLGQYAIRPNKNLYSNSNTCDPLSLIYHQFEVRNQVFFNRASNNGNMEDQQLYCPSPTSAPVGEIRVSIDLPLTGDVHAKQSFTPVMRTAPTGGIRWTASSWTITGNKATAIFVIHDASAWNDNGTPNSPPTSGEDFRDFMQNSIIEFWMGACCPYNGSVPKIINVSTDFRPMPQGPSTCANDACFIALSQTTFRVGIQCPGCVTPGTIVDHVQDAYKLERKFYGFEDVDNDGIAEVDLLTNGPKTIDPTNPHYSYNPPFPVERTRSIVGDVLEMSYSAKFQDGSNIATGAGGFSYGDWLLAHPNNPVRYILFEQVIENANLVGFELANGFTLHYTSTSGLNPNFELAITPVTGIPSSGNPSAPNTYSYVFNLEQFESEDFSPQPDFSIDKIRTGDIFELRADYKICKNHPGVVELNPSAILTLSPASNSSVFNPPFRQNHPDLADYYKLNKTQNANGLPMASMLPNGGGSGAVLEKVPLWICSTPVGNHTVYPVTVRTVNKTTSNTVGNSTGASCTKPGHIEIEYLIGTGEGDVFPYEFRMIPHVALTDFANGTAPWIDFRLDIPVNYIPSVLNMYSKARTKQLPATTPPHTILWSLVDADKIATVSNGPKSSAFVSNLVHTLNTNISSPNTGFAVPLENGNVYFYTTTAVPGVPLTGDNRRYYTDANGSQLLLVGDEQLRVGINYQLYLNCETTQNEIASINNLDATAYGPNIVQGCNPSSSQMLIPHNQTSPFGLYVPPGPPVNIPGLGITTLHVLTGNTNPVGNEITYVVRAETHREVDNVILFFEEDFPNSIGLELIRVRRSGQSPSIDPVHFTTGVSHNGSTYTVINGGKLHGNYHTMRDDYYLTFRYTDCSALSINNTNTSYVLPLWFEWNCQELYSKIANNEDPIEAAQNGCSVPQKVNLNVTPRPVLVETRSSISLLPGNTGSVTDLTRCTDDVRRLKVELKNLQTGGIGEVVSYINIPDGFEIVGSFHLTIPGWNVNAPRIQRCTINNNLVSTTTLSGNVKQYRVNLKPFTTLGTSPSNGSTINCGNFVTPNARPLIPYYGLADMLSYYTGYPIINSIVVEVDIRVVACDDFTEAPTYHFEYAAYCNPTDAILAPLVSMPIEGTEGGFTVENGCIAFSNIPANSGCEATIPSITLTVHKSAKPQVIYSWSEYVGGSGTPSWTSTPITVTVNTTATITTTVSTGFTPTIGNTYVLTAHDANGSGCPAKPITLIAGSIYVEASSTSDCYNGTVQVDNIPMGTGYTYVWKDDNGITVNAVNTDNFAEVSDEGTYYVTVTDAYGCSGTAEVEFALNPIDFETQVTPVNCATGALGSIKIFNVKGGAGGYTYQWNSLASTASFVGGLSANTTYTVTVTDAENCTKTFSTTIGQAGTPPSVVFSGQNPSCAGGANGTLTAQVQGASYSVYTWSHGPTTGTITGLGAGTYSVTASLPSGACTVSGSTTLTTPAAITVTGSVTDVTCNGASDGTITISVSGGTGGYNYSWANQVGAIAPKNATLSGLPAGTYSVTVTDGVGCSVTSSGWIVAQPTTALSVSFTSTNISCHGGSNGTITTTVSGGSGNYEYRINGGTYQSSNVFTGLPAGTHHIQVHDITTGGCIVTSRAITQPLSAVSVTLTPTAPTCHGGSDGKVVASVLGGTGNSNSFTYTWTPVGTLQSFNKHNTGLSTGWVSLSVADINGCLVGPYHVFVAEPAEVVSTSATITDVLCNGGADGIIELEAVGGLAPYTYSNDGGTSYQSSNVYSGLTAGTYSGFFIKDANGKCSAVAAQTVGEPFTAVSATATATDAICFGSSTGSIEVTATGGIPSYAYSLNGAPEQLSNVIDGLPEGTYSVEIFDVNGCSTILTNIHIDEPATLLTADASAVGTVCNGAATGNITVTESGGDAPYEYSVDGSTYQSSNEFNGLTAGSYTAYVKDANGCVATENVVVSSTTVSVALNTTADCDNFSINQIEADVTGSGPYTYAWSTGATTSSISNVAVGTYTVTVTGAAGCTATTSTSFAIPSSSISLTLSITDATCGNADGGIDLTVTGGQAPYTYVWAGIGNPYAGITEDLSGVASGGYLVTVTDAYGCVADDGNFIGTNGSITLSTSNTPDNCPTTGDGSATVVASGGTAPYSYNWVMSGYTGGPTNTGLAAGWHPVIVTDDLGCTEFAIIIVDFDLGITVSTNVQDASCGNLGSVDLTVTGPDTYTYEWSNGFYGEDPSGLPAGTYSVYIENSLGCVDVIDNIVVNDLGGIGFDLDLAITDATCGGTDGGINLTVIGGQGPFTYAWAGLGNPYTGSTEDLSGMAAGVYLVTVTGADGCTADDGNFIGTSNGNITLSASSTPDDCPAAGNGSATVVASGGTAPYSYHWLQSGYTGGATNIGLMPGWHPVTVTDANGCAEITMAVVDNDLGITVSTNVQDASCGNLGSIDLTVTGPDTYTYEWSTGATTEYVYDLSAGTYAVYITNSLGCTQAFENIVVGDLGVLPLDISTYSIPGDCALNTLGSAGVNGISGGLSAYTYLWSNGATTSSISPLAGGTYSVTITSSAGCQHVRTMDVLIWSQFSINPTVSNANCGNADGAIDLTVTGGGTPPYTYKWSTGATTEDITGLAEGNYSVTVTDADGCSYVDWLYVAPEATFDVSHTVTAGCTFTYTGAIDLTVTGGTAPYTYYWSNNSTSQDISGLEPGTYSVTITDDNNCYEYHSFYVFNTLPFTIDMAQSDCGYDNGMIEVTITGGTPPYTYNWSNSATTSTISNLAEGPYNLTVYDTYGCNLYIGFYIEDHNYSNAAQFSTSNTTPTTADIVYFTNTTVVGSPSFEWFVDAVSVSTNVDYSHTFTSTGSHYVWLKADYGTCFDVFEQYIYVSQSLKTSPDDDGGATMENLLNSPNIMVYPNPTNGEVNISFSRDLVGSKTTIEVMNVTGQLVDVIDTNIPSSGKIAHDLGSFSEGVYILRITNGQNTSVHRIVLMD